MSEANKTPTATQWAKAVTEAAKKLPADERDRITSVYHQTWTLVVLYEAGLARPTPNAASRLQALCEVMLRRAHELSPATEADVNVIVARLNTPTFKFFVDGHTGTWRLFARENDAIDIERGELGSVGDPVWAVREAVASYIHQNS